MSINMVIHLNFLEPYRLVAVEDQNRDRFNRGQAFALAHRELVDGKDLWRPSIKGFLLRSAVLKAAEDLLGLKDGIYKGTGCCCDPFSNEDKKTTPKYLRKRDTLTWENQRKCTRIDHCPYCSLLGSFNGKDKDVYFHNLYLNRVPQFAAKEELASERILNRVDFGVGKAQDYFKVWEVHNEEFRKFKGKISVANEHALVLLKDSLRFVDRLCGALCVIKADETNLQTASEGITSSRNNEKNSPVNPASEEQRRSTISPVSEQACAQITTIFESKKQFDKLRILADAVRAMRSQRPDAIKMPEGKDDSGHFIWDGLKHDGVSVRSVLEEAIDKINQENTTDRDLRWREFCDKLGQGLYDFYKSKSGGFIERERLLGDVENYSKPASAGKISFIKPQALREWIFAGKLRAETPFYFGVGAESGDQTSFRILLDRNTGKYRIPRSVLRGVLRRELRFAFDEGCYNNEELGRARPCICPVCTVMRGITIMDSRSDDCPSPPEIRHRIRLNQQTGVVDEGALFDIEVGPEGITFPFILRYRGAHLTDSLKDVLYSWTQGMTFFGGSSSTGKGRFKLEELEVFPWNLMSQINVYIAEHGFRDKTESDKLKQALLGIELAPFSIINLNYIPRWTKIKYEIEIKSPLLTNDPIAALFDTNNHDAVVFKKPVWDGREIKYRPVFKGESIRGIVRSAFGRQKETTPSPSLKKGGEPIIEESLLSRDHEDCTCSLCKTFGNEHEAGKLNFEDLTIENPVTKHFDHVAIDRFTGGGADKKKFDDCSLAGTPALPIKLIGRLWVRTEILDDDKFKDEKEKLVKAFCDVRDGLYPLGAKGGIGYGWVAGLKVTEGPEDIKGEINRDNLPVNTESTGEKPELPEVSISELDTKAIYNPHYFLKPGEKVHRNWKEPLTGHHKFHDKRLTGKIVCTLKTLTPLIIPDTDPEKVSEDLQREHKTYKFFRINDELMIPGSEIRGPVSSVFEAMTNSCFRVFEEEKYLSRRIDAKKEESGKYRPGIVRKINGDLFIVETKTYRLPIYDEESTTKKITFELFENECKSEKHKIKTKSAIAKNKDIAAWAGDNRTFLQANINLPGILAGSKKIKFKIVNESNDADEMALLGDSYTEEGYIKFTGLNMVNQKNMQKENEGYPENHEVKSLKILLSTWPDDSDSDKDKNDFPRKILRKPPQGADKYPRPVLICTKDNKEYTIFKRCERVFKHVEPDRGNTFKVLPVVARRYKAILSDYKNDYGRIDKKFRTIFQNDELTDGDLVYFLKGANNNEVKTVIPVQLSRASDSKPLGKRMPGPYNAFRSCNHEILEDIDANLLNNLPEKQLFRLHKDGLCPACRLFGTTHYKGRVRFGFASVIGEAQPLKKDNGHPVDKLTLPLLESPRPTWSIPNENAKVPGRKFYVHHAGWKDVLDGNVSQGKNNCTVEPLAADNMFTFEIQFENLENWELGLLLHTLELENGCKHKLGKAKAFGFGSVEIKADKIDLRTGASQWENATVCKDEYKQAGFQKMNAWFEADWRTQAHVKNLLLDEKALLKFQNNPEIKAQYPDLDGYTALNTNRDTAWRKHYLTTPWSPWHTT